MTRQEIIAAIEAHAEATGLSPSTITGRAVGNSRLYARLVAGRGCTIDVAERLRAWIAASAASANEKGAA